MSYRELRSSYQQRCFPMVKIELTKCLIKRVIRRPVDTYNTDGLVGNVRKRNAEIKE